MDEKLSPWFDLRIDKPERVGVYQVKVFEGLTDMVWYSFWDGTRFGWVSMTRYGAYADRKERTVARHEQWRGVVK